MSDDAVAVSHDERVGKQAVERGCVSAQVRRVPFCFESADGGSVFSRRTATQRDEQ